MTPELGRAFWMELHGYAEQYPEIASDHDQAAARAWLEDFAGRLRAASGACPCADEWEDMVMLVPVPLEGREVFHAWTVAAHDRVNKRLGRRLFDVRVSGRHLLLRPRRYLIRLREMEARANGLEAAPMPMPMRARGLTRPMVVATSRQAGAGTGTCGGCGRSNRG